MCKYVRMRLICISQTEQRFQNDYLIKTQQANHILISPTPTICLVQVYHNKLLTFLLILNTFIHLETYNIFA